MRCANRLLWLLLLLLLLHHYYAPAPIAGALSDDVRLTSDVCLSHTSGLVRTERPRKTKIGTEVAHVTRDSDTTFKVKRSKVNLLGAGVYCGGLPHSLLLNTFIHQQHGRKRTKIYKYITYTHTERDMYYYF